MIQAMAVIGLAMAAGGLLAYLGSQFGRQVGRRKITFLGLRPRYTSMLVTIMVGMFISLFTMTLVAFYSEKAKAALIGFKNLQKGKQALSREIVELNRNLNKSAALFVLNEPVATGIMRIPGSRAENEQALIKVIGEASREAEKRSSEQLLFVRQGLMGTGKTAGPPGYDSGDYNRVLDMAGNAGEDMLILAYSEQNVYIGDRLKLRFSLYPDRRLFKKGEAVLSVHIKGGSDEERILFEVIDFMRQVEQKAERKGMVRVPRTRSLIDIPLSEVLSAVREIRNYGGWVEITACAVEEITAAGPLAIRLRLNPR